MYQQILLAVALQQWEEFTPHALAARDVAAALAKGSGAKLSVLSVYDYGKIKEPSVSAEMAARYREDMMQRIDGSDGDEDEGFPRWRAGDGYRDHPHGAGGRAPQDDHRGSGAIAGGSPRHRCPQQTERTRCGVGRDSAPM